LWTLDLDRPAERLDTILEADEAGSPTRVGAADFVADRKAEPRVVETEIDLDARSIGVLRGIRQGF
jgi:hypothetical protein